MNKLTAEKWQCVTNCLPPYRRRVIVKMKNGCVELAMRYVDRHKTQRWRNGQRDIAAAHITHWIDIPDFDISDGKGGAR